MVPDYCSLLTTDSDYSGLMPVNAVALLLGILKIPVFLLAKHPHRFKHGSLCPKQGLRVVLSSRVVTDHMSFSYM